MRSRRILQMAAVFCALSTIPAHSEQFNTSNGANYTTSDSAFKLNWDATSDVLQLQTAPAGTAGNAITWTEGVVVNTGGQALLQIGNDAGGCTAAKLGRLRYDGTATWEYCNGSAWVPFEQAGSSGPADCPDIGDQCTDTTVYVGYHPTLNVQMFLHPNNQSTGSQWSSESVNTSASSDDDGEANQAWIVANKTITNYPAFKLCDDLNQASALGYTDWYLPSRAEILHLWLWRADINAGPSDNFVATDYWSSTESTSANGWRENFSSGIHFANAKSSSFDVRCMRRN